MPCFSSQDPPVACVWNGEGGEQGCDEAAVSLPLPRAARIQPAVGSRQLHQHPQDQLLRLRQHQPHPGGQAKLQQCSERRQQVCLNA